MSKIISSLFLVCLILALSIAVMIFGWGLEVKSWGWVIGGYFGIICIGGLSSAIND